MIRSLDGAYNLTERANRYGSDKGTTTFGAHHYTPFYEMLLAPRREGMSRMLEIGLLRGGPEVGIDKDRPTGELPSVRMWLDYFPNAMVHGFDISDFSFYRHERFTFHRGDSGNAADLEAIIANGEMFDFIIDDGSHASYHQQLAFAVLFRALKPGGLYIIEDLQWQSPAYEETLPATVLTRDLLLEFRRTGRFPELAAEELKPIRRFARKISEVLLVDQPFSEHTILKTAVIQKAY